MKNFYLNVLSTVTLSLCLFSTGLLGQDANPSKNSSSQETASKEESKRQLPKSIEKLGLDKEQRQQMIRVCKQFNQKVTQKWSEFKKAYAEAVEIESAMLAATSRMLHGKTADSSSTENPEPQKSTFQSAEKNSKEVEKTDKKNASTNSQESPEKSDSKDSKVAGQAKGSDSETAQQTQKSDKSEAEETYVVGIVVSTPVYAYRNATLNNKQRTAMAQSSEMYSAKLRTIWQQLQDIHMEIVQLEAQKLKHVYTLLTEEQLKQLEQEEGEQQQPESAQGKKSSTLK